MFIRFGVISLICLVLPFGYEKVSPFRLGKCKIYSFENRAIAKEIPDSLNYPFTFLAEGTQAYVFLSQDKKHVLKLFKNVKGVEKIVDACRLAYEIRDLTGVIFVHAEREAALPIIHLKDQLGRVHPMDPAHMCFVLQKRADPFFRTIRTASKEEQVQLIASFYALLKEMNRRGIANLDNSLGRNYGFINGRAVAIDFGKFAYAPQLTEEREAHMIRRLNKWLQRNKI